MHIHSTTKTNKGLFASINPLFLHVAFLFVALFLLAVNHNTLFSIWRNHLLFFHVLIELLCAFIALTTFFALWHMYQEKSSFHYQILGFCLLLVGIFLILHTYHAVDWSLSQEKNSWQNAQYYLLLSQVMQVLGMAMIALKKPKISFNRYLGLFLTSILFFSSSITSCKSFFLLAYEHTSLFIPNFSSYLFILTFLAFLLCIKKQLTQKDIFTYPYISSSLLFGIIAEICFIFYGHSNPFYNFLFQLCKAISFYYLFKGILVGYLTYPYKKQQLENLQLQTTTILNAIDSPVLIFGKNKRVIAGNRAFQTLTQIPLEKLLALDFRQLKKLLQFKKGVVKKNNIYECSISTCSGTKKELQLRSSPISNLGEAFIGSVIFAWDITENKGEQKKLHQQEKLASLGRMAAGIVHEIKNPLTTIKGFCQMITLNSKNEKIMKYTQTIEEEVSELNKVVIDFLHFAKPQSPILKEIYLGDLIHCMKVLLESHCFMEKVDLQLLIDSEQKTILADESQLKQVILNMVENAIDALHTTTYPAIKISTKLNSAQEECQLIIADNGEGMSEEQKQNVGTPFFTTKDKGTGLGLSICYQIIKKHRGKVTIESAPEQGTSFILSFPTKEKFIS